MRKIIEEMVSKDPTNHWVAAGSKDDVEEKAGNRCLCGELSMDPSREDINIEVLRMEIPPARPIRVMEARVEGQVDCRAVEAKAGARQVDGNMHDDDDSDADDDKIFDDDDDGDYGLADPPVDLDEYFFSW